MTEESAPENGGTGESVSLPDGTHISTVELTRNLDEFMPRSHLQYRTRIYRDSFKGSDGVTALMKRYGLKTRHEAVKFGVTLQKNYMLDHVCGDHQFQDEGFFYRLQPYHAPNVLNSYVVWDSSDRIAMGVVAFLTSSLDAILRDVLSHGGEIDYVAAERDPRFLDFHIATCELQTINMSLMDDNTKLAFGNNVYNLLVNHAFVKLGVYPTSSSSSASQRVAFFDKISYNIGGEIMSLNDLRKTLVAIDPRIHFALWMGGQSSPEPQIYGSSQSMYEELTRVTEEFFASEENATVDEDKFEVTLSMLCQWYKADLLADDEELPDFVVKYLQGRRKSKLEKMIALMIYSGRPISVKFKKYVWSSKRVANSKAFKSDKLDPNYLSVKSMFGMKKILR